MGAYYVTMHCYNRYVTRIDKSLQNEERITGIKKILSALYNSRQATQEEIDFIRFHTKSRTSKSLKNRRDFIEDEVRIHDRVAYVVVERELSDRPPDRPIDRPQKVAITCYECGYLDMIKLLPTDIQDEVTISDIQNKCPKIEEIEEPIGEEKARLILKSFNDGKQITIKDKIVKEIYLSPVGHHVYVKISKKTACRLSEIKPSEISIT